MIISIIETPGANLLIKLLSYEINKFLICSSLLLDRHSTNKPNLLLNSSYLSLRDLFLIFSYHISSFWNELVALQIVRRKSLTHL